MLRITGNSPSQLPPALPQQTLTSQRSAGMDQQYTNPSGDKTQFLFVQNVSIRVYPHHLSTSAEAVCHYISECPEELQQVPWAVGLQDQVHGQTFGLTVQHPHHILVFTHCGVEKDPIHKLLDFELVGAICVDRVRARGKKKIHI